MKRKAFQECFYKYGGKAFFQGEVVFKETKDGKTHVVLSPAKIFYNDCMKYGVCDHVNLLGSVVGEKVLERFFVGDYVEFQGNVSRYKRTDKTSDYGVGGINPYTVKVLRRKYQNKTSAKKKRAARKAVHR